MASLTTQQEDALLKGLEEAVAHVVEAFVANPDEPVNVACPGMRQVLVNLEELLMSGLVVAPHTVELPPSGCVQWRAEWDPLWGVLKTVRLASGGLEVCGQLERLLSETEGLSLPAAGVSHGWHWSRHFLLSCLNSQLLHNFLESLLSDSAVLGTQYEATAPVRVGPLQGRVGALAAALNGVHCHLEHWGLLLLEHGPVGSAGQEEGVASVWASLHGRYGAVSPNGYLLQPLPLTATRIAARESHVVEVVLCPPCLVLVWQWDVEAYDVAFGISDDKGLPLLPTTRCSAGRMVEGVYEAQGQHETRLCLKWDNSYSLRRGKRIRYRFASVSPTAYATAASSSADSITAAIWRHLSDRYHAPSANGDTPTGPETPDERGDEMSAGPPSAFYAFHPPPLEVGEEITASHPSPLLTTPNSTDGPANGWASVANGGGQESASPLRPSLLSAFSTSRSMDEQAIAAAEAKLSSSSSLPSPFPVSGASDALWSYLSYFTEQTIGAHLGSSTSTSTSTARPTACHMCDEPFGLFRRPHRCRRCAHTFCLPCSRHRVTLNDQLHQRVCARCYLTVRDASRSTTPLPPLPPIADSAALGEDSASPAPSPEKEEAISPLEALRQVEGMGRFMRMVEVGVPPSAVAQKMAADCIDQVLIDRFLSAMGQGGSPAARDEEGTSGLVGQSPNGPAGRRPSLRHASSMRLKSVYWEELAPERAQKSVFGRRSSTAASIGQDPTTTALPPAELQELATLFGESEKKAEKAGGGGRKKQGKPTAGVLDTRRLQNVGIVCSYFRRAFVDTDDLLKSVLMLNPDKMPAERVAGLLEVLPSEEERRKLRAAGAGQLSELETFMLHLTKVPRLSAKIRAFHQVLCLDEHLGALERKVGLLLAALGEVMGCDRLVRVLEVLLLLGNTLNAYGSNARASQVHGVTIHSLLQVVQTKSSTGVTLLDYFIRLAAEKGEGHILGVQDDMPSLKAAVALPDAASLDRELRVWKRQYDAIRAEVEEEKRDLDAIQRARAERREARLRAVRAQEEAAKRAEEEAREQERMAREEEARHQASLAAQALHRTEVLRALKERVGMEGQDNRRFRGQHFFVFLSEAESDYATSDPAFLRQVCLAMGYPPLPLELAESLNEGEGDVEGVKRVNDELGGVDGEDDSQQGLLTLASRWLVAHARITRLLASTHGDAPIKDKVGQRDKQEAQGHEGEGKVEPPSPSTLPSAPRLPKPLPSTNGHPLMGGGGRSALLAALSGGGLGALKKKRPATALPPTHAEEEEGKVEFERERGMFVSKLSRFLQDTDGRVGLVWAHGRSLQDRAQELYEYFGEDSVGASSSAILSTLFRFLQALHTARLSYEKAHGPILLPSEVLPTLPLASVGQRLASRYGPGVVEAVRMKDKTVVLRLPFGVAYVRRLGDILTVGDKVATVMGPGTVKGVRRMSGVYEVALDWGAVLYTPAAQVKEIKGKGREGRGAREV